MLILTFEEFNNKFNIDNSAMSDIRIKDIGKDISLTPIEIVMRDRTPNNVSEPNSNIIVNLHPTEGTHWVLVIRREGGPVYYFDSFGIETPPLFLEEYVNLGSNERIQQYDESYCGAYCLYMIYLIDRGFRINNALNILVNQCKYPGMYNECFCLGCNEKVNDIDKVNDNDNQGTCFTDDKVNDNDKINDNDKVNDNDNVKFNDNDNDNDNDNVNANDNDNDNLNVYDNDNDETIYQRSSYNQGGSYHPRSSPNLQSRFPDQRSGSTELFCKFTDKVDISPPRSNIIQTSPIAFNINNDLQSWLNDDDIITEAEFPDNFRCIISGPSECGKTFLLKKLFLASIYFDKLYIIGPTGDQYQGTCFADEGVDNGKANVEFIKDIKDLPSPDKIPKDLKKLMIFDDVRAKEPIVNEYFCRGRHNNCNMIHLNQNLFSLDRQSVRENSNLFILFEQRGKALISIYQDFFNNVELSYNDFANICNKVWKEPYNYIVIDKTKNKNINGKLRINWDRRVL